MQDGENTLLDPKTLLIKAPSQTDLDEAIGYVRSIHGANHAKSEAYVREVYRLYAESGYSPEIVIAQWDIETGTGTSQQWLTRNNPAGIGITDGGDRGHSWPTPADAAQAQEVHLSAYVDGYSRGLRKYLGEDPRYLLVLGTDWAEQVRTVDDLTGKWATDPLYGQKIAERLQRLRDFRVSIPDPQPQPGGKLTYGRVPRPIIRDRVIPDADNIAWNNLGQRKIVGVVYHRQLGTNWGTDGWFRMLWQPNGEKGGGQLGLTDYGIDRNSGEILKWNDPYGKPGPGVSRNRSGHASGGSGGESGDGVAFVWKLGRTAINRDLASVEIDGWQDSPVSQAGYNSIVGLSAHLADSNLVPWTDYPYNPHTGLPFTYWHNEFQREKDCPWHVVESLTPQIIEDTKTLMKRYQEG
jgi:hypothetical protein